LINGLTENFPAAGLYMMMALRMAELYP